MIIGFDNNRCYGKMVYVFGKLMVIIDDDIDDVD